MIHLKSFFSRSFLFIVSLTFLVSCSVLQPKNPYTSRNTGDPMVPTRKINRIDPPRSNPVKIKKARGVNPPQSKKVKPKREKGVDPPQSKKAKPKKEKGVDPPSSKKVKIKKADQVSPPKKNNKRYLNNNKKKKEEWAKVKPVRGWDCPWDRSFRLKSKGKINKKLKKAKKNAKN